MRQATSSFVLATSLLTATTSNLRYNNAKFGIKNAKFYIKNAKVGVCNANNDVLYKITHNSQFTIYNFKYICFLFKIQHLQFTIR